MATLEEDLCLEVDDFCYGNEQHSKPLDPP